MGPSEALIKQEGNVLFIPATTMLHNFGGCHILCDILHPHQVVYFRTSTNNREQIFIRQAAH